VDDMVGGKLAGLLGS